MATSIIRNNKHMPPVETNGTDWKESNNINGVRFYYYENKDTTEFDLPSRFCFVMVMNYTGNRGAAIAIDWRGDQKGVYVNRKHDSWIGWFRLQVAT